MVEPNCHAVLNWYRCCATKQNYNACGVDILFDFFPLEHLCYYCVGTTNEHIWLLTVSFGCVTDIYEYMRRHMCAEE